MGSQTDGLVPMLPPSQRHLQQQILGLETPKFPIPAIYVYILAMYSLCIDCVIIHFLLQDSRYAAPGFFGNVLGTCVWWRRSSWQTPDLR